MPTVYIAGPMRGIDGFNFPAFDRAARQLRDYGHEVTSPAEMDRKDHPDFDPTLNDLAGFDVEDALRRDFRVILEQDAIVLLPGWRASTGARAERFVAEVTGRRVYTLNPDRHNPGFQSHLLEVGPTSKTPDGWAITDPKPELLLPDPYRFNNDDGLWHEYTVPAPDPIKIRWIDTPPQVGLFAGTRPDAPGEYRVTDSDTGAQKGQKLRRMDLVAWDVLEDFSEFLGLGARKYEERNWEAGYAWSLSIAAMSRHLARVAQGYDLIGEAPDDTEEPPEYDEDGKLVSGDPTYGQPHVLAIIFHAVALARYMRTNRDKDDRPAPPRGRNPQ